MRVLDAVRERSVLRAAHLYFLDGLTQAAIAERLGCTRWTVGRLLREGEESGIIDIRIQHPHARNHPLELALKSIFGLLDAQVVATQPDARDTLSLVARTAADYLADLRPRPRTVAVAWGRTTAAVARAVSEGWNPGVRVIQANAAPEEVDELLGTGPARYLAQKGPGDLMPLDGVTIVRGGREARLALASAKSGETMRAAAKAEVLLYSPGGIAASSLMVRSGHLTSEELRELWQRGAVANILCRIVDAAGQPVSPALDDRTLAMPLSAVRQVRSVIAVGSGQDRAMPFLTAMGTGLANIVVTDADTAQWILDTQADSPHSR